MTRGWTKTATVVALVAGLGLGCKQDKGTDTPDELELPPEKTVADDKPDAKPPGEQPEPVEDEELVADKVQEPSAGLPDAGRGLAVLRVAVEASERSACGARGHWPAGESACAADAVGVASPAVESLTRSASASASAARSAFSLALRFAFAAAFAASSSA